MAKRLFIVEVSTEVVVLAADEVDAERVTRSKLGDIVVECDPDVYVGADITQGGRLPAGWTHDLYPYPVGNKTIAAIQAAAQKATERVEPVDMHTIDMFTGKALIDG